MGEITQVGLGLMGSALARALLAREHQVTVWNRSPTKTSMLISAGARVADSIADAVRASSTILICIDGYTSTRHLFEPVALHLAGRTVIQLSTGTPGEARESEAWFKDRGAKYLDGAILAGPPAIGKHALILVSGDAAVFAQCKPFLAALAGDLRYVGAHIGAAAALDLAWLSEYYGFFLGAIHGARLCESEQVDIDQYVALFAEDSRSRRLLSTIQRGQYDNPTATLAVWYGGLRRIQDQARAAGINCEIPDFAADFFKRAIAAGHGDEDVAALVKILRPSMRDNRV